MMPVQELDLVPVEDLVVTRQQCRRQNSYICLGHNLRSKMRKGLYKCSVEIEGHASKELSLGIKHSSWELEINLNGCC